MDPSRVSINKLHELTNKDRRTVRRRLQKVQRGPDGLYDAREALRAIYSAEQPDDLETAQALLYHHRANLAELKAERMRAELVPVGEVVAVWEDIRRNIETTMRGVVPEAAREVRGLDRLPVIEDRLAQIIHATLHQLADYVPPCR